MICASCGGETPEGKRFCKDCGAPLGGRCPSCNAATIAGSRFCADCGDPLESVTTAEVRAMPASAAGDIAAPSGQPVHPQELRHVSVLFCDLVGFTPLSESRDPAEMRDFLSGYFEVARAVIGRYGGVIEKFIGDAVMAVWGAPVAKEDDAERAVRAGLELIDGVSQYGREAGLELEARVGIVTGRASTAATDAEGLVIGERVNTAARIQSVAPPSSCYVDETTRTATSAAIAYADAGTHELKGKAESVQLFRALRVEAAVAGSQRSGVLEAPFTGREHEVRLLKELLHASLERSSARLALVSGVAGIGKSRLGWELFKYVDGIAQELLWHSGHCLSYGDGVSYWALSEMVRARLQIGEQDTPEVAAERMRAGLERWIPSQADREFIAPRLAQLLGIPSDNNLIRQELFAGWRLFFERLSEHLPVVMVVEDLQWADPGLIEFLDQLLDWSADHPIFLLVLTRPEGIEKAGPMLSRRNTTNLSLDPLPYEVVGELLDGLVSNLPQEARTRIIERAEGIPLYAVETVRTLIDRGVIDRRDDGLYMTGELGALDVPPELTALISSRLDTLGPKERQLVKECAVLGDTFPLDAVQAVTDLELAEIEALLPMLVRREVLTVRADKLSPDRGQYAFTQSLIRQVAYEMLTGPERKVRHLRTARHLQVAFSGEGNEMAELIAAHLHDAYRAAGHDADAEEIRAEAERAAVAAGDRADDVGANEQAEAAYLRAAELAVDELARGHYVVKAAIVASQIADYEKTIAHATRAREIFDSLEDRPGAASAEAALGLGLALSGRHPEAIELLQTAIASIEDVEVPPRERANLHCNLGVSAAFTGRYDQAKAALDTALLIAQQYELDDLLSLCFNFTSVVYRAQGRITESRLYLEASVPAAKEGSRDASRAENNLGWFCAGHDLPGAEAHLMKALAIARRWGSRAAEAASADSLLSVLTLQGRYKEAQALADEVIPTQRTSRFGEALNVRRAVLDALRGEVAQANERLLSAADMKSSPELQLKGHYLWVEGLVRLSSGDNIGALGSIEQYQEVARAEGYSGEGVREAVPIAVEAALALGTPGRIEPFLAEIGDQPPGVISPSVKLQLQRARALLAAAGGDEEVEESLVEVERGFATLGYPYWQAKVGLDLAEFLHRAGRYEDARTKAVSTRELFAELGATPMTTRADVLIASLSDLVASS
jgi:class 3 adenylate cyclase/tetratricopeptide (TPR) repeat protein